MTRALSHDDSAHKETKNWWDIKTAESIDRPRYCGQNKKVETEKRDGWHGIFRMLQITNLLEMLGDGAEMGNGAIAVMPTVFELNIKDCGEE